MHAGEWAIHLDDVHHGDDGHGQGAPHEQARLGIPVANPENSGDKVENLGHGKGLSESSQNCLLFLASEMLPDRVCPGLNQINWHGGFVSNWGAKPGLRSDWSKWSNAI